MPTYTQLELPIGEVTDGGLGFDSAPDRHPSVYPMGARIGTSSFLEREAISAARGFLVRLTDPRKTPRVPRIVRAEARALLARYPSKESLARAASCLGTCANSRNLSGHVADRQG